MDRQLAKVYGLLRSHLGKYVAEAKYDIVLIDCPPNFNIVTKNAIVASDGILIPRQARLFVNAGHRLPRAQLRGSRERIQHGIEKR